MKKIVYLFVLFLLMSSVACDNELKKELEIPYNGDRIVLNGVISPDSVKFSVTKSLDFSNKNKFGDFYVKSPKITILDTNMAIVGVLQSNNSHEFFSKNIKLQEQKKYKVKAEAEGLETVETEWIEIPQKAKVLKVQRVNKDEQCNCNTLIVSIQDNASIKDYYSMNIAGKYKNKLTNASYFLKDSEVNENKCYTRKVFSDNCFNGKSTDFRFGVEKVANGTQLLDSIICRFGTVSKSAYDSYESRIGDDESIIEGLNDPVPTFSNVKKGYGFVFAQNWNYYKFKVE